MSTRSYTAIIEKEGNGYVALCPELDVASQGNTIEETTANLKEAVDLFLECDDPVEIQQRLHTEILSPGLRQHRVSFASSQDVKSAAFWSAEEESPWSV